MAKIKIKDLPKGSKVSEKELRLIRGGLFYTPPPTLDFKKIGVVRPISGAGPNPIGCYSKEFCY